MISCYTTLFNLDLFSFDIDEIMSNWLYYFDEVVIATNKNEEDRIKNLFKKYNNKTKIVSHVIDFSNQRWDGSLKDLAMKNCSNEIVFQIDSDERLSGDRNFLKEIEIFLEKQNETCCLMIENIDLYFDLDHYKSSGAKWYIHKKTKSNRGVVNFAKIDEINFDPEKSDGCELIDDNGDLIKCLGLIPKEKLMIFHLGHLDFNQRVKLNQFFWKDIWSKRKSIASKKIVIADDVLTSISDMESIKKYKHNFKQPLWQTISTIK
jgi:hypothetical protein